ncbi:MAG: type II toxin-antitoxin system RelE/ParE family toxin [Candidatus Omnitrophica bacterium]|nr:type II toxin-antitoxin system RelE/ParE family toxin [Candidatus Omnitrophota bacterium]
MKRKLARTEEAREDVIDQARYIARDSLNAALHYLDEVESAYHPIRTNSGIGSPQDCRRPRLAGLRMLPVRGFEKSLIFCRVEEDRVVIVRVLHSARDIERLFEVPKAPHE